MNPTDIIEALENAVPNRSALIGSPTNASRRDILNYKRSIMTFLDELDAELTVGEIRSVLEEYE